MGDLFLTRYTQMMSLKSVPQHLSLIEKLFSNIHYFAVFIEVASNQSEFVPIISRHTSVCAGRCWQGDGETVDYGVWS